uniref:Uncharacterized protein n=1 Tax=Anguilla anguilla TaxID=7936 RepID=A0A0E9QRF1_ANGAN
MLPLAVLHWEQLKNGRLFQSVCIHLRRFSM